MLKSFADFEKFKGVNCYSYYIKLYLLWVLERLVLMFLLKNVSISSYELKYIPAGFICFRNQIAFNDRRI